MSEDPTNLIYGHWTSYFDPPPGLAAFRDEMSKKLGLAMARSVDQYWSGIIGPSLPPPNPYPMPSLPSMVHTHAPYYGEDYRRHGDADDPRFASIKEGKNMANPSLSLYEVYITDRRHDDDNANGIDIEQVRAVNENDAKLKAILRNGYAESDIKYLDFGIHCRIPYVQDIDDAE